MKMRPSTEEVNNRVLQRLASTRMDGFGPAGMSHYRWFGNIEKDVWGYWCQRYKTGRTVLETNIYANIPKHFCAAPPLLS